MQYKFFIMLIFLLGFCKINSAQEFGFEYETSNIIKLYEQALNGNNVDSIVILFTDDGVGVLQGAPTIIGSGQIKDFYLSLFSILDFNLQFTIEEIVQLSSEWVLIRTSTNGTVNSLSNNQTNPVSGHELFILKKLPNNLWKIARYAGASS